MNCERYDGQERRFVEYDMQTVLQIQSLASLQTEKSGPKFLL